MTSSGPERFDPPEEARLRSEAHGMARAYVNAVLAAIPRTRVVGLHAEGAAYRPWDSLLDYVPEISDVDVRVRMRPDEGQGGRWTLERALDVAETAHGRFRLLFPEPSHHPRPRLLFLDGREGEPARAPPPLGSVHTLWGEPYDGVERRCYPDTRRRDARRFLHDARFVELELPMRAVDRPDVAAWSLVSDMAARVGAAGPRLLTQLAAHSFDAWSMNRTSVWQALIASGQGGIAESYAEFYRAGWEGYRARFTEARPARRALEAAARLFAEGRALIGSVAGSGAGASGPDTSGSPTSDPGE